jgi:hypothetical protein
MIFRNSLVSSPIPRPTEHASDLVLALLPGHGFSGKPQSTGWVPGRVARAWADPNYHKLIHWHEVDLGGHFAAWKQPELFTDQVRAAFRSLRSYLTGKYVLFNPRPQPAPQRIEAETIDVYFRRPIRPKFQHRRRDEL